MPRSACWRPSLTRAGNRPATISAQQTIPYVRMLPDGICQLPGGVYTKTLEYEDINYSVASAEDQTAIFSGWSAWLNYFDSSLPFQLSFVNRRSRSGSRYKVNIPEADDRFNSVRTEYTGMLKNQIAKLEAENSEIVEIVRGMSISLADLPLVLQQLRGGASGHSGQKPTKQAEVME